jgi:hypothetical protein
MAAGELEIERDYGSTFGETENAPRLRGILFSAVKSGLIKAATRRS